MTNTAISVSNLKKAYKQVEVLRGVDFSVPRGTVFALPGPNGAGKPTTVKILSTLLSPDGGSAQVCGFDVTKNPRKVREAISLTGQNVTVDYVLTGRENLQMMGKLRHLPDANRQAEELLRRFDLLDAADRRISTYSGGMSRRLDLAMSLLGSPSVVFLDEPTTGLDPQARLGMWAVIKDLARSGVTIFLTTQYLEEADQLADRIAILHEGRIVVQGTAAELKNLLPRGHIELQFGDAAALTSAQKVLSAYTVTANPEKLTLSVVTDGTVRQMNGILSDLYGAGIEAASLEQKLPTLEDVFLTIVGGSKEARQ